jgi:hypothetical protein
VLVATGIPIRFEVTQGGCGFGGAAPCGANMSLGFNKHRTKIQPDSIDTLEVPISLLKALSCCFLNTFKKSSV